MKTHCCSATHTTSRIGIGTSRSSVLTSSRRFNSALAEVIDGFRIASAGAGRTGTPRALMMTFDEHGTGYELRFDEVSDGHRALIVLYGLIHLSEAQECTLLLGRTGQLRGPVGDSAMAHQAGGRMRGVGAPSDPVLATTRS